MKGLRRVLVPALTGGFYRAYAGWLTAAAFLVGGIMSGQEHKALILAALVDLRVLAVAYLLPWALYTLVSVRYAWQAWATDENEVLRVVWLVHPGRRWLVGLSVQALVLAPCWVYAGVIAGFAVPRGAWEPLLIVVISLLLLTVLGWTAHERALRGPRAERRSWLPNRRNRTVPTALWWLHEQLHAQPWGLLALKVVSVASIIGLCTVYSPETFDVRLLTLGGLITALLHSLLPGVLYAWERGRLTLLWNQPLGPGRRLLQHAGLFGLLLLPEALVWLRWFPVDGPARAWWALRLWALPVALLLLTWASLLWRPVASSALMTRALSVAFGIYLLLMGRVPLELLTLTALLAAVGLGGSFYWRAEDVPVPPETSG